MPIHKTFVACLLAGVACGPAAAADLSNAGGAIPAWFASEIVVAPAPAGTLFGTSASPATRLNWTIGHDFSLGEVRHVRVACDDTIRFNPATTVSLQPANGSVGAINGLGGNVLTFSITSGGAPAVRAADVLTISGDHRITSNAAPIACSVALYDQPSQAQAGGSTGLIPSTKFEGPYLAFAPSYELLASPSIHTADVDASPAFGQFVPGGGNTTLNQAFVGQANGTGVSFRLRAPSASQVWTFGVDGQPITLASLLAPATAIVARGDFGLIANANNTFNGSAMTRTALAGIFPTRLDQGSARYPVGSTAFQNDALYLINTERHPMSVSEYYLDLEPVSAQPGVYAPLPITGIYAGRIARNGTALQAPLVQVPSGWISRLVLTNTGGIERDYRISVQGEAGNDISTANLTGKVPAFGTVVVEDLSTVLTGFSGKSRATLNVTINGPDRQIQGLYQTANPVSGSLSNYVLVRPGTN